MEHGKGTALLWLLKRQNNVIEYRKGSALLWLLKNKKK